MGVKMGKLELGLCVDHLVDLVQQVSYAKAKMDRKYVWEAEKDVDRAIRDLCITIEKSEEFYEDLRELDRAIRDKDEWKAGLEATSLFHRTVGTIVDLCKGMK